MEPLFETHFGNFVGIAVLSPGTTQCVVRYYVVLSECFCSHVENMYVLYISFLYICYLMQVFVHYI